MSRRKFDLPDIIMAACMGCNLGMLFTHLIYKGFT